MEYSAHLAAVVGSKALLIPFDLSCYLPETRFVPRCRGMPRSARPGVPCEGAHKSCLQAREYALLVRERFEALHHVSGQSRQRTSVSASVAPNLPRLLKHARRQPESARSSHNLIGECIPWPTCSVVPGDALPGIRVSLQNRGLPFRSYKEPESTQAGKIWLDAVCIWHGLQKQPLIVSGSHGRVLGGSLGQHGLGLCGLLD